MELNILVSLIGLIGTLSSIYFGYIALKKKDKEKDIESGKLIGSLQKDIEYILEYLERLEKNLDKEKKRQEELYELVIRKESGKKIGGKSKWKR